MENRDEVLYCEICGKDTLHHDEGYWQNWNKGTRLDYRVWVRLMTCNECNH